MSEDESGEMTGQAALELNECEERYRVLFSQASDGIVLIDMESGHIVDCNPEYEKLTCRKLEQLKKMSIWELRPPEKIEAAKKKFLEIKQKGRGSSKELEYQQPGGKIVPIDFLTSKVVIGGEEYLQGIVRDITERQRVEKSIQVSRRFLEIANRHTQMAKLLGEYVSEIRNLTGCAAVGLRIMDKEGNIPYQSYTGFSKEFYELENPLSIKSDQCMCVNVAKGKTDPKRSFYTKGGSFYLNATTRFLKTVSKEEKGTTRNVCNQFGYETVAVVPIRLGDRILGLIHIADPHEDMVPLETVRTLEYIGMQLGDALHRVQVEEELAQYRKQLEEMVKERTGQLTETNMQLKREIKERREVESALKKSEERFRSVFEDSSMGMVLVKRNGQYTKVNQAMSKVFGYSQEEFLSMKVSDLSYPGDIDQRSEEVRQLWAGERDGLAIEKRYLHKDGHTVWGSVWLSLTRDAKKKPQFIVGQFQDITARKRAEEELKKSEERYRTLFNSGNDAIFVHQPSPDNLPGKFIEVNDVACKMLGYTRKKLSQLTPNDIVTRGKSEITPQEAIKKLRTAKRGIFESAFNSKKGTQIPVEVNIHLFDLGGRPTILTVARDITKRKQVEKEMREKELRIRELVSAYVHAQEEERQWMSLEIHDRVIQPMSAIYQQIQSVQSNMSIEQQAQRDMISSLALTKDTIRDTKQLIHDFYPTTLTRYGLIKLMNEEICQLQSTGYQTKMSISRQLSLPQDTETTLYRVFHEALLNIKKHARAESVAISLSGKNSAIELVVEDDGIGFDVEAKTMQRIPGGLESMRRRTEILGGTLKVSSVPGQGTRLAFIIPLTKGNIGKVARQ